MPGILDYNKVLEGYGPYSTSEFRQGLLERNLPPPITHTLIEGGLTSYLQDLNKLISFPTNAASENIPIHYDANETLFPLGEFYRDTQNVNLNTFVPENEEYVPFNIVVPPNLGTPIPQWGGERVRTTYPAYYNEDSFDLINKGDKKGIQYPYSVVDNFRNLNLNKESSLGLIGGESLKQNIIDKVSQVEMTQVKPITLGLQTKDNFINWMRGTQQFFNKLSNDSVGWQEYNSNNRQNGNAVQQEQINSDLGNNVNPSLSTEQRMGSLLSQTNDIQVGLLLNSFNQNIYRPLYTDSRMVGTSSEGTNSRYYIGSERTTNRGATIATNFISSDFNGDNADDPNSQKVTTVDENFFWNTGNQTTFNEKTILYKTQKLLDEHPDGVWINQTKKYYKDKNLNRIISRGNAISKLSFIEAAANGAFCRVWTVNDNYNYLNAIRNTGLFSVPDPSINSSYGFSVSNEKASLSVLMDNGIPKYHPVADDSTTTFKKYMLSLENLAWSDNLADLPLCEIGPGDLLTGNKGRIMWFPPYDLSFDESISANWQKQDFLGRSEPVFTYNNTTRSGSLKFKVLVDHPKVINGYRGKRTDAIERFFAGCISPTDFLEMLDKNGGLSESQKNEIKLKLNETESQKADATSVPSSKSFEIIWELRMSDAETQLVTDDNGNKGVLSEITTYVLELASQDQKALINIESFQGVNETANSGCKGSKCLSKERGNAIKSKLKLLFSQSGLKNQNYSFKIKNVGDDLSSGQEPAPQSDRRSEITVSSDVLNNSSSGTDSNNPFAAKKQENLKDIAYYPEDAQLIDSLIIDETKYFDYVDGNFPNYFTSISEKIKYFHPGFHSTTPEGLNTRLTFLQQCMRQGPSIYDNRDTIQAQNLAFGRPPICILRIGDFFHTKVAINSLNITYEAGSAIQWDLNPEGIGVQPMMANVTMSLDIIGGQSLVSPINRLQNALSFNFYANTEMYDPRADSVDKSTGKIVDGIKLGELKNANGVDTERLEEALKKEGIVDQTKDNKNSGDNTETPSKGDFTITPKNEVPTNKIAVTAPSGSTENLTRIIISKEQKNGDFEEIINSLGPEKEFIENISSDLDDWRKDDLEITELEEKNINLKKEIIKDNELILTGATSNVNKALKDVEKKQREVEKNEEKIEELSKNPNKIKVKVYYDKDEKGSTKNKTFTYKGNKLN
jgi:hypothetical protein